MRRSLFSRTKSNGCHLNKRKANVVVEEEEKRKNLSSGVNFSRFDLDLASSGKPEALCSK